MIIYRKSDETVIIPCGLGPVVCPDPNHELQMKQIDSSTVIQYVEPDSGYYGLYRVIVNPLTDGNLLPGNIKEGVEILGVMGTYAGTVLNLQAKNANPSLIEQVITFDQPYNGLSSVTIAPVSSDIDPDIQAGNIRRGVDILGVTGTFDGGPLQSKTIDPSTSSQTVTPDNGNYGLSSVTVNPYTLESKTQNITLNGTYSFTPTSADGLSSVDISVNVADIPAVVQSKSVTYNENGEYTVTPDQGYDGLSSVDISVNIPTPAPTLQSKTVDSSTSSQNVTFDQGYDGLSSVTVNPYTLDSKTVDPSTSQITINSSADGLSSVTVNAVTSNIDPDIQAGNIKRGVEILGVAGTFDGGSLGTKTVNSSTSSQTVTPESSDYGLSSVTVNPYTVESNSSTLTVNGTYTFTPTSADALSSVTVDVSVEGQVINNQSKTVDSSTSSQIVNFDSGYTGLSQVTVNPYVLDSKTVNPSTSQQIVTSDEDGLSSVTVNAIIPSTVNANSSTNAQTFTPIFPNQWYNQVNIAPYTVEADSSTLTANGQYTFTPQNADALSSVTVDVSINAVNNQSKTVNSSTSSQSITPDQGYTGLSSVTVNPYVLDSKTVNPSTNQQVITSDEDGLSSVTVNAMNLQSKTYNPYTYTTYNQAVFPDSSYDGLEKVVIAEPDSMNLYLDSSTVLQEIAPRDKSVEFFSYVKVNPYTVESDSSTLTANGQYTFTPQNADALSSVTVDVSVEGQVINNQSKTVDCSTSSQTVTPDQGYTGLSSVTVNAAQLTTLNLQPSTTYYEVTPSSPNIGYNKVQINPYILDSKTVDPSTVQQVITSDADGLSSVTVNAVTSTIDTDIQAGNIKRGVEILGVTGTFDGGSLGAKTIDSSTVSQTITPDSSDYGLSSVTVNPYTVETKSVTLTNNGSYTYTPTTANAFSSFNVDVSVGGSTLVLQTKSITANTTFPATILPDEGYDGFSELDIDIQGVDYQINAVQSDSSVSDTSTYDVYAYVNKAIVRPVMTDAVTVDASINQQVITPARDAINQVTVNAVDASIDSNIQAGNIKAGVTILGITGNYSGTVINNQNKTVDPSTNQQSITADSGYTGLGTVTVNRVMLYQQEVDPSTSYYEITPQYGAMGMSKILVNAVDASIDSNIQAENIKSGVTILGVQGTFQGGTLQSKTVDPATSSQTVTPDSPNYGLSSVTVNAAPLQNRTVDASVNQIQVSRSTTDYYGLRTVTINAVTSSIDSNIVAGNIKKDVTILGVTGTYEGGTPEYDAIYAALIEI